MLNLLFVSNSPKVYRLKSALQPVLKVIIDVVPDFDHGLKDVFEKRPATVCIQEQIAGVTGESVARHIQMLLGGGAPRFVLMHEGNGKAKAIKGLFEHLLDLNMPDEELADCFQGILKKLLGDQWERIYIPPPEAPSFAAVEPSWQQMPPEPQPFTDIQPRDFEKDTLSATDDGMPDFFATAAMPAGNEAPPKSGERIAGADGLPDFFATASMPAVGEVVQPTLDEMADLLLEQASQADLVSTAAAGAGDTASAADAMPVVPVVPGSGLAANTSPFATALAGKSDVIVSEPLPEHKCHVKPVKEDAPGPWQTGPEPATSDSIVKALSKSRSETPLAGPAPKPVVPAPKPVVAAPKPVVAEQKPVVAEKVRPAPAVPVATAAESQVADFRISQAKSREEEPIPDDLLKAFEKNYHSENNGLKRILLGLLLAVTVVGGWFFVKQKPQFLTFLNHDKPVAPAPVKKPATVVRMVQPEKPQQDNAPAAATPAKTVSPPANSPQSLPAFVPLAGRDASYAAKNPGWERYLGKNLEVRVFKSGTKIKAVQVMAAKGRPLSEAFMKSCLKQLVGSEDYRVEIRENKGAVMVWRGSAAQKADILLYRRNNSLLAFVVSLN